MWSNLRDDACDDDVACWPGACTELRASISSPDRAHVARVLLTTGGGATTADGAEVCVDDGWRRRLVGVGYDSDGVGAAWTSPTTLRIDHLARSAPPRTVDVTTSAIACEPVRDDWDFCTRDGTR